MRTEAPDTYDLNPNPTVEQTRNFLSSICNLVLVIDRSKARFFGTSPFHLETISQNSLGREKSRAMRTDRLSIDDETDPHEEAAIQFAREISHQVQRRLNGDHTLRILIVCEARMHGYLHRFLDDARVLWHSGDLGHSPENEILKYLVKRRGEFELMTLKH